MRKAANDARTDGMDKRQLGLRCGLWSHARCSPSTAKYPTTIVQYHYVLDVVDCTCSYVLIGLEMLNFTVYWAQKIVVRQIRCLR